MPPSRRLADLEKTLELWYEQLGGSEKALPMTFDPKVYTAINQDIRVQILPEIRKYEAEYWQLLTQEARHCDVPEDDASLAIVEIVPEVEIIQSQPSAKYPDELIKLLLEIRDKLNEPGTPAAAKAKFALSLVLCLSPKI
ncbi:MULTISPECIES: hypothetical protein [Aerosakkonema]|uniref:hypothetical protein n=1 Tax=Aerosakkonema TaxID=1246629 RepID=UPI0035B78C16